MPLLLAVIAVVCLTTGGLLAKQAWSSAGVTLSNPRPLDGQPLRRYTVAVLVMLVGVIAAFILVIRLVADRS